MPAGFGGLSVFPSVRRLRVGSLLLARLFWLTLALCLPGLAMAQVVSPYCPTQNLTVSNGGSVTSIDLINCDGPFNFGMGGPFAPDLPVNGTAILGPQSGPGNQTVTYTHNGSATTTDTFKLEDENGDLLTFNVTISPPASAIVVSPASLPTLTAGTPFSQTLSSSGGTAPYTYTVQSGTLPVGLNLSSSGVLSGMPTQRGSYSFTVRSTDSVSAFVDRAYAGTVQNPTLSISPTSAAAVQNIAFSQTVTASGGVAPYSFLLETGSFPAGISISSAGVISGTTSAAPGSYPVTLRVTDASTGPGSYFELESFTLNVSAGPSVSISVAPSSVSEDGATNLVYTVTRSLNLGSPTTVNITTSGTATPGTDYTGNVATVTIPSGATTATITINPTIDTSIEANETVILTVAAGSGYAVGAPSSATGTILNDDVQVSPGSLPNPMVGAAYSQTLSASGGTGPYSFAVSAGGLPTGLTLTTGGVLSGTPTEAGSFSFTISATDSTGSPGPFIGSQAYSVTVAGPTLVLTPFGGALSAPYGTALAQTFSTSGGIGPYTYSLIGTMPPGGTLAGDTLSGTPTAPGTYNFAIVSRDTGASGPSSPYEVTDNYVLTVSPAAIALSPATLPAPTVGAAYNQALSASGGVGPYSYSVSAGALPNGLSLSAGGTLSGTPTAAGSFTFTVTATDANTQTGSQSYTFTVAGPTLVLTPFGGALSAPYGTPLAQTFSTSGGIGPYTYSLIGTMPPGGTLAGDTLSGTPTAPGTYNFAIVSRDNGASGPSSPYEVVDNYVLTVSAAAIALSPATLPNPALGTAYSQAISASGGVGPYTYNVSAGAVPGGMALSTGGTLSGTPTAVGTFSFTVTASDANTQTGSQAYTVTVGAPTLALTPAAGTLNAPYGAAYSQAFVASGSPGPYSYSLTGPLPPGMSFSGNVLSGTPVAAGNFPVSVTATDTATTGAGAPFTVTSNYTIAVPAPTVVVSPATLPNPATGTPYSQTLTASGGIAPYSFTVSVGALPSGLLLSPSGALTGTATQIGTFSFSVTATDANSQTGIRAYTVTVGAPTLAMTPAAGTLSLPYGSAYTQAFTASGSPGPYSYVLTGSLPTGVTFSGGTLSGTPTSTGSFPVTVTATDTVLTGTGAPFSVAQNYTLDVPAPTFVIAPTTLPDAVAGDAFSQQFTVTGGVAPYTFALTGGSLPTGLTLSPSGLLAGSASDVGDFSPVITVTDSGGQTGVFTFQLKSSGTPRQTLTKVVLSNADQDGNGKVSLGDTLTYQVSVNNTGSVALTNVVVNDALISPSSATCATVLPGQACVLRGTYTVTAADAARRGVVNVATASSAVCAAGSQDPQCRVSLSTQVVPAVVRAKDDDFGELMCPKGDVVVGNAFRNDSIDGHAVRPADILASVVSPAKAVKPGKPVPELNTATGDVKVPAGTPGGDYSITYRICQRAVSNNCDTATIVVKIQQCQVLVRVIKTTNTPQTRVGEFVSYTLQIDNLSENDTEVEGLQIEDLAPPGFSLVPGSVRFQDVDDSGTASGNGPFTLGNIDLAANGRAYVTYAMRVGANARRGNAVNAATPFHEGEQVGTTAKAVVAVVADPDTDETTVIGSVFVDRNGDGMQDSADASDVRIQGGFDPAAYVAGSTTVDRGQGAQPLSDASAPLHGIDLGSLPGRSDESEASPASRVVVSQLLTAPQFVGETVLTTGEGTRLLIKPSGEVVLPADGKASGNGQVLSVERTVTPQGGQYRVDYVITNRGVSEWGVPGVRLASPEGLVVQTDSYGRFHLEGIDAAARAHGRNFVLKLDPASLPPGARVTTRNPLVRRLTGGLMVRFDFGIGFSQ
jgi:large repetitive protein